MNKKSFNKNDLLLIVAVLLVAAGCLVIYYMTLETGGVAVITADGEVVAELPLAKDTEYELETALGRNLVVVKDSKVYVSETDCPDGLCKKYNPIDSVGQAIICLPHKVVIEVKR